MDLKQNYFEIFDLPVAFQIDVTELAERYRNVQKAVHPDRFKNSSGAEQRVSMQLATQVNSAYVTLKSPLSRAIYMLQLLQVEVAENPVLAPDFLMEQIELREELEALEDDPAGLRGLEVFKSQVQKVLVSLESDFVKAIETPIAQGSEIPPGTRAASTGAAELARLVVYKMQFMNKLLAAANHLEEKLLGY